jgi:hypothetical protein
LIDFFIYRLKKVQSKKKERAAVEEAVRLQEIAEAEKRGLDGKVFVLFCLYTFINYFVLQDQPFKLLRKLDKLTCLVMKKRMRLFSRLYHCRSIKVNKYYHIANDHL